MQAGNDMGFEERILIKVPIYFIMSIRNHL